MSSPKTDRKSPQDGQRDTVLIDLALQGGGSHGAFTWGVMDRLLEEPWLLIDGISGTSAGAMNAMPPAVPRARAPRWTISGAKSPAPRR